MDNNGNMLEKSCSFKMKRKDIENITIKKIEIVSKINLGNWAKICAKLCEYAYSSDDFKNKFFKVASAREIFISFTPLNALSVILYLLFSWKLKSSLIFFNFFLTIKYRNKYPKIKKEKIKKKGPEKIQFSLNDDVLKKISFHKEKPKLVIGFSAETNNLLKNTKKKLKEKGCDWILANEVKVNNAFSSDMNKIFLFDKKTINEWPKMKKKMVALKLTKKIVSFFKNNKLLNYEKNLL